LLCHLVLPLNLERRDGPWSAREIRAMLAPRLFAAGQALYGLDRKLTLDAHSSCVRKMAARVTEPLFVETIRAVAASVG
jgi:hypothetical protein